jgi:hypothetical protein
MTIPNLKELLQKKCLQIVENQIDTAQKGILEAQQAANEDTKSSAGDKYETTRAMMQIEIENCSKRLAESQKLQNILNQIIFQQAYEVAIIGSLVMTNQGNFFLAIGIGKIEIEKQTFFAISPASPIGEKLYHKKVGEEFMFNGKKFVISSIL